MLMLGLIVFVLVTLLMPVMIYVLNKKGIIDDPDYISFRRAHDVPTPRGGGLVVMPVVFIAWFLISYYVFHWPNIQTSLSVVFCGMVLCGATWFDDYKKVGLSVRTRLIIQLLAVGIPLILWPLDQGRLLPHALPVIVERILMAVAWLWFCNLYNFMDGINGISGMEAISIAGGLLVFCFYGPVNVPIGYPLLLVVIVAAALGFLVWNGRSVAKTFLGDVGSIGFGYCLGFLLFVFATQGHIIPAVLVSLVYSMDATTTLLKIIWQHKKIWESRREHYYHRATVNKEIFSHLRAVGVIFLVNLVLTGLGLLLLRGIMPPITGLVSGMLIVILMLTCFYYLGHKNGHVSTPRGKMYGFQIRINKFMRKFFH
jgi:UDP-N-acetylmuramyl pentapeptide phosphotransferase/UDP-N-acetylglucosamine-1-phosphate transferase